MVGSRHHADESTHSLHIPPLPSPGHTSDPLSASSVRKDSGGTNTTYDEDNGCLATPETGYSSCSSENISTTNETKSNIHSIGDFSNDRDITSRRNLEYLTAADVQTINISKCTDICNDDDESKRKTDCTDSCSLEDNILSLSYYDQNNNERRNEDRFSLIDKFGEIMNSSLFSRSRSNDENLDSNNNDFYCVDRNYVAAKRKRSLFSSSKGFLSNAIINKIFLLFLIGLTTSTFSLSFASAAASRPPFHSVPHVRVTLHHPSYQGRTIHRTPITRPMPSRRARLLAPRGLHPTSAAALHFSSLHSAPHVSQSLTVPSTKLPLSSPPSSIRTSMSPSYTSQHRNDEKHYTSLELSDNHNYDFINTIHPNDTLSAEEFIGILQR